MYDFPVQKFTKTLTQVHILGTSPSDIDRAEDRFKFSRTLETLKIAQPQWKKVEDIGAAKVGGVL